MGTRTSVWVVVAWVLLSWASAHGEDAPDQRVQALWARVIRTCSPSP